LASSCSSSPQSRGGENTSSTTAPLVAAGDRVRRVRRDDPDPAWLELARLVADAERDRAGDHHPELLVDVLVLGQRRVRLDLDDRHRELGPVHDARDVAVGEHLWRDRPELLERLHRGKPSAAGHR
jgi:hypothetical protein